MHQSRGGIGSRKHGKSGHSTKSPRYKFLAKLEAEKFSIKNKSKIINPVSSVKDLFNKQYTGG